MKFTGFKRLRRRKCGRCRRGPEIVGRLCGHCYAADVARFEKKSEKTDLRVK